MHHIKVIKDGNVNNVVKEQLVDGVQYVDNEPHEGSLNGITSDAVAKVAGDVGEVKDVIPEGTTEENPLVTQRNLTDIALLLIAEQGLEPKTVRMMFTDPDFDPTTVDLTDRRRWTKCYSYASIGNIWDCTHLYASWTGAFAGLLTRANLGNGNDVIILGSRYDGEGDYHACDGMFAGCDAITRILSFADLSDLTSATNLLSACTSLREVPVLFRKDTACSVSNMFGGDTALTSIPSIFAKEYTGATNGMFKLCTNVKSGQFALYTKLSGQSSPPTYYDEMFLWCGIADIDGYCELCEVPVAWGGTQALVIEKSQGGTYEATLPGAYAVSGDSVYIPYELEVQHVVYDRSFAASVRSTMWLPFDLNIGAFTDDFDFQIISVDVRDGTIKVIYSAPPASGIIPKNTPISIQRKEQSPTERLEFGTGTFTISTQPKNVQEPVVFEGYEYQPVLIDKYTVFEEATDELKYYGFRATDGQLVSITAGAFINPYKVVIKCSKIEE